MTAKHLNLTDETVPTSKHVVIITNDPAMTMRFICSTVVLAML